MSLEEKALEFAEKVQRGHLTSHDQDKYLGLAQVYATLSVAQQIRKLDGHNQERHDYSGMGF